MATYSELGQWQQAHLSYQRFLELGPNERFTNAAHLAIANCLIREKRNITVITDLLSATNNQTADYKNVGHIRQGHVILGDLASLNGDLDEAIENFSEAARIGNEQGVRATEAWSGLARAHAAKGNFPEALRIIRDGVDDHGHAAAVVYLANGDLEDAKEAALEFYTWAWAQGEPYVRRWELEQARQLLQQLGEPEPQLPVWDESKYEPFPHEEAVIAFIEELKSQSDQDNT